MAARSVVACRAGEGGGEEEGEVQGQLRTLTETEKPGGGGGGLSNELSAPYEVPQFPIEKIESKMAAAAGGRPEPRHENSEEVVVPHYQRVSASGDDVTGVPIEDLKSASSMLAKALAVRQKYMRVSKQEFPSFCDRFLAAAAGENYTKPDLGSGASGKGKSENSGHCKLRLILNLCFPRGATIEYNSSVAVLGVSVESSLGVLQPTHTTPSRPHTTPGRWSSNLTTATNCNSARGSIRCTSPRQI